MLLKYINLNSIISFLIKIKFILFKIVITFFRSASELHLEIRDREKIEIKKGEN